MPKPEPSAERLESLREQHFSAARWERVRAAYFLRQGKPDHATRCKLMASNHIAAARDANVDASMKGKS